MLAKLRYLKAKFELEMAGAGAEVASHPACMRAEAAVVKLERRVTQLKAKHDHARQGVVSATCRGAFVTFNNQHSKTRALEDYKWYNHPLCVARAATRDARALHGYAAPS